MLLYVQMQQKQEEQKGFGEDGNERLAWNRVETSQSRIHQKETKAGEQPTLTTV